MNIVKIKCLKSYRNKEVEYRPGQVYEVREDEAIWLLADAPGCFVVLKDIKVEVEDKAIDAPPVDKMVRKPRATK